MGQRESSLKAFGLRLDSDVHVRVIIDKALFKDAKVAVHPLKNGATTVISSSDLKKFVESCGNQLVKIDFHE